MKSFAAGAALLLAGAPPHAVAIRTTPANPANQRIDLPLMFSSTAVLLPPNARTISDCCTSPEAIAGCCSPDGIPSSPTDIRRAAVLSSRAVGAARPIARTAGRALDLLMLLVERGQNGLTARELAHLLGAPRTSVADLLKVLENKGFVAPTAEGHGWRLDFRVAQLGNAYLHEFSVREVGRAAMRELSRRTGLTTKMAVLDHSDIVCIGSPILGADGRPEAAISLAGLSAGMPIATIENLGRTVARTASQVSGARGGIRAIQKVKRAKIRRRRVTLGRSRRVRGAA